MPRPVSAQADIRDAFFEELYWVAAQDPSVILLADDQGAFALKKLQQELKGQYLNIGIAEQNAISLAAGLALGGKKPFVYGIATFVTLRCYEQIKLDLCCMNLPVTIIGSGAGLTYGSDGPTHHATQDVALMRTLPEISIFNPTDAVMTAALPEMLSQASGPSYVRIEKGVLPQIYSPDREFSQGFEVLRTGSSVTLVATGYMVHTALQAAGLLSKQNIDVGVVDLYRIKPVDSQALCAALNSSKPVVTLEEHSIVGGIGSLVSEILADAEIKTSLKRIGLPDKHGYDYGDREWLLSKNGLDPKSVAKTISKWLQAKA